MVTLHPRLAVALIACALAGAASVVGGACLPHATEPPRLLASRPYVLTGPDPLPLTITDTAGRTIRVLADTITFLTAAMTYHASGTAGVTPRGGSEQPPTTIAVSERAYTLVGLTLTLPSTIGGRAVGIVGTGSIQLTMPNGSVWVYSQR